MNIYITYVIDMQSQDWFLEGYETILIFFNGRSSLCLKSNRGGGTTSSAIA